MTLEFRSTRSVDRLGARSFKRRSTADVYRATQRRSSAAAIVRDDAGHRVLAQVGVGLHAALPTVAEWRGFLLALQLAQALGATGVRAFGDSLTLVEGYYRRHVVRKEQMVVIARHCWALADTFSDGVEVTWVPRELNRGADALCTAILHGCVVDYIYTPRAGVEQQ